jgi:hypothetical protein
MTLYRFYHVGPDGHFKRADAINCASDADALAEGATLCRNEIAIEVWAAARFVARIDPAQAAK